MVVASEARRREVPEEVVSNERASKVGEVANRTNITTTEVAEEAGADDLAGETTTSLNEIVMLQSTSALTGQ